MFYVLPYILFCFGFWQSLDAFALDLCDHIDEADMSEYVKEGMLPQAGDDAGTRLNIIMINRASLNRV